MDYFTKDWRVKCIKELLYDSTYDIKLTMKNIFERSIIILN